MKWMGLMHPTATADLCAADLIIGDTVLSAAPIAVRPRCGSAGYDRQPAGVTTESQTFSAIHALLHTERYLGRLIWGASRWKRSARNSKNRTRVEVPREQWTIVEKPELRLVSDETWQRVRARDTPATYGSHNARPKYPLSGLLLCTECGRAMTLCGGTN